MSEAQKKQPHDKTEFVRDIIALFGVACVTIGVTIEYGFGYGLIVQGVICLGLIIIGSLGK